MKTVQASRLSRARAITRKNRGYKTIVDSKRTYHGRRIVLTVANPHEGRVSAALYQLIKLVEQKAAPGVRAAAVVMSTEKCDVGYDYMFLHKHIFESNKIPGNYKARVIKWFADRGFDLVVKNSVAFDDLHKQAKIAMRKYDMVHLMLAYSDHFEITTPAFHHTIPTGKNGVTLVATNGHTYGARSIYMSDLALQASVGEGGVDVRTLRDKGGATNLMFLTIPHQYL